MSDTGKMSKASTASRVPQFEQFDDADVRALIEAYPLAWVCAGSGLNIESSLLPLVGVYDEAGRLTELIGHLMRRNPLYARIQHEPGATLLFKGPDAYVSPEHSGRQNWAPTWNYAQLRIGVEIRFDEAETEHSLRVLIDAMERSRDHPWGIGELGERYPGLLALIIGFRARVIDLRGRFKLGQDESPETLHAMLERLPHSDMVRWMRRFNEGR